jgi:transcriptional regulator with XRE-family HTH domain
LGAAITQARLEAGLGLADLASRLNMGVEQLEALESGDLARLPEPVFVIAQARRIAQNLGVTIDGEIQALRQTNILNSRPTEVQNLKLNAESVEGRGPEANQARWGQGIVQLLASLALASGVAAGTIALWQQWQGRLQQQAIAVKGILPNGVPMNDPTNLITLCESCHRSHHHGKLAMSSRLPELAVQSGASMTSKWHLQTTSLLLAFSPTTA